MSVVDGKKISYFCTKCGRIARGGSGVLATGCSEKDCPIWTAYKQDLRWRFWIYIFPIVLLFLLVVFLPEQPKRSPKESDIPSEVTIVQQEGKVYCRPANHPYCRNYLNNGVKHGQ